MRRADENEFALADRERVYIGRIEILCNASTPEKGTHRAQRHATGQTKTAAPQFSS
jgi:hypothetical protein